MKQSKCVNAGRFYFALLMATLGCSTPDAAGCSPSQGCASWEEGSVAHVWIDDPEGLFSDEDLEVIDTSLTQWEEATNQFITFEMVDGEVEGGMIIIRPGKREEIREDRGVSAVTDYSPFEVGGTITVPYDMGETFLHLSMLHELGHTLGLGHHEGCKGVMATPSSFDFITCYDVVAFCDQNGCNAEEMPPCLEDEFWHTD